MKIAAALRHFGEEPPLVERPGGDPGIEGARCTEDARCTESRSRTAGSGGGRSSEISPRSGGSGTVFFTGCTMRCGFCQNRQLSRSEVGGSVSTDEFADICLRLQEDGALNVNLVSGTPFVPGVLAGIHRARSRGLNIPVVWNSSGYETEETVELLSEVVDIFLPDLKLLDESRARRLFAAPAYPETASRAIQKMIALSPLRYDEEGSIVSGTFVRHLVLPGLLEESRRVLQWCAENGVGRPADSAVTASVVPARRSENVPSAEGPRPLQAQKSRQPAALLSLMVQFGVPQDLERGSYDTGERQRQAEGWKRGVEELENRSLSGEEYDRLLQDLEELGIEEGFVQEPGDESPWWPDFTRRNPFPAGQAVPLWHYADR